MSRSSSGSRIGVLGGAFLFALVVVLLHLWLLMVNDREAWARRSYENRWAFRSVPSQRGALRDRFGRVLARDQATSEVSIYYERFRKYNVVGAAVHAAIEWTRLRPGHPEVRFGYYEGGAGPTAAAQELLAMPVAALRRGVLSKEDASKLWLPVVTVLSGCSGLSRSQAYTALRSAAEAGVDAGIGDVLELPRAVLLDAFDERLRALQTLDLRIADAQARRADRLGLPADELKGLFETLEMLRVASLEKRHHYFLDDDGKRTQGSLLEQITRVFAVDVEFELAAALRVDSDLYTGIDVFPSVTRVYAEGPGTSLRVLLGRVLDYDRSIGEEEEETWFRDVEKDLRDDWLEQLVPDGIVAGDEARAKLRETARRRYEREVLSRERRGVTGFEAAFDRGLSGKLGMRFVEHDAKHREQLLWSHLRVESGDDVQVTIDADLQRVAEQAVQKMHADIVRRYDTDEYKLVEAAITLIDAQTGDVLCHAGAPIVSSNAVDVPGVRWTGNGSIGSLIKPLIAVEHLECVRTGLPHRPVTEMKPCEKRLVLDHIRSAPFMCDDTHGYESHDPATAIAESCNIFFYQAGLGLGNEGLRRALRRFGLLEPEGGADPFAACWQPSIPGLATAKPRMNEGRWLVQRAIGYSVQASPVQVARAYAGLATGALPTLGLRFGEQRPRVSLDAFAESIGVACDGMRQCVLSGTAKKLGPLLKDLGVHAKTGTAEVGTKGQNNAWFAGFLPQPSRGGVQIAFCAVCYWVPDKTHGSYVGNMVVDVLTEMQRDDRLREYYLTPRND